jgi:signal transduction histidine kinase
MLRELRRRDYEPVYERVESPEAMETALKDADQRGEPWEVVLADYYMPRFQALDALKLLQRLEYDLPFIVVSGRVGEEAALEAMRAGAHDYVTKDNMTRLAPLIERETREAKVRREREKAEGQLRQSVDALIAIYEASQLLSSTLESEEIGARLLKIMQRISSLSTAVISMPDERGHLQVWRAIGLESLWSRARYTPEAQAALYQVLGSGEHRLLQLRHPTNSEEVLSTLYLPLRIRERTLGVLEVYGSTTLTNSSMVETEILISLASKAASALENARLYGELSEREGRLQELVGKLITTQEEERRRVAYEVHDGLTQVAVAAYQHLQAFTRRHPDGSLHGQEMLDRGVELVRHTVEESRRVIADLRPTALDDFGLPVALRLQAEALREEGWDVVYEERVGDKRLPATVEIALYRVAREALTNVRKHAETDKLRIEVGRDEHSAWLTVQDWGKGFDPAELSAEGPGERIGVSGMRERASLIGGELAINSESDSGTTVTVRVPLQMSG